MVNYITQSDVDKGVRLKMINGKQFLDVTTPVEAAVYNAEKEFAQHKFDFGWFYNQVRKNAKWDIKVPEIWYGTIGTTGLSYNQEIMFQGNIVTPEILGNMTYGYLGSAANLKLIP